MQSSGRLVAAGFTLVELALSLSIMSILSAIALPRAARFIDSAHVRGAVIEIESLFESGRHLAIARGAQVALEIDPVSGSAYVIADTDTLRSRQISAEHGVELSAPRIRMVYSAIGLGYGAANLSVVVRRNAVADTVVVSRLGRVRH
jgi:prepilin-type N-terminal cleavage/methylation domain-containing protein